jgi:hypothetical protein
MKIMQHYILIHILKVLLFHQVSWFFSSSFHNNQNKFGLFLGIKLSLETDGIYHFGNIPSDEIFLSHRRRQLHHFKIRYHHLQFQGCLSTIKINNQLITFDINVNNEYNYNIKTCYENQESGIFINGQKEIILGKRNFHFLRYL